MKHLAPTVGGMVGWASEMRRTPMHPAQPPPVVIPGTAQIVAAVTAVLPAVPPEGASGLRKARMTDLSGAYLYWGWIPAGARLVMRGQRVFMHWGGDEWRQQPVVKLTDQGRPA